MHGFFFSVLCDSASRVHSIIVARLHRHANSNVFSVCIWMPSGPLCFSRFFSQC